MLKVPPDGLPDPLLKLMGRGPAQVALNLGGIYGITTVMARTVPDEGNELARISASLRRQFINGVTNGVTKSVARS